MNRLVLCVALFCVTLPAAADMAAVRRLAESQLMLGDRIEHVQRSPYAGLYEVDTTGPAGPAVYYVNPSATLIFSGQIIDARTGRSLTQERVHELAGTKWQSLPFDLAIKTVRGKGRLKIAVFSDPNCSYCRQFEKTLAQVDDITVYTFLYPVLKPSSVPLAESVWCSQDRAKAWEDWMLRHVRPAAAPTCETPISKLVALGKSLGASVTPTWFLQDGKRYQGPRPRAELVKLLDLAAAHGR